VTFSHVIYLEFTWLIVCYIWVTEVRLANITKPPLSVYTEPCKWHLPETAETNTINKQTVFFSTTTILVTTHICSVTCATNNHPWPLFNPTQPPLHMAMRTMWQCHATPCCQQNTPPPSATAHKWRSAHTNRNRWEGTEVSKSPPPTTDLSNMESRCHVTHSDVATKRQTTTGIRHLSSYILGCHSEYPIPPSSQPTLLKHRMTCDHRLTTPNHHCTIQWQWQYHVTGPSAHAISMAKKTWHVSHVIQTVMNTCRHSPH